MSRDVAMSITPHGRYSVAIKFTAKRTRPPSPSGLGRSMRVAQSLAYKLAAALVYVLPTACPLYVERTQTGGARIVIEDAIDLTVIKSVRALDPEVIGRELARELSDLVEVAS